MNRELSDELLSGWIDGETTPEQSAAVENRLAESDELRRQADQLRQVSRLLREMPREKAPADLVNRTMERLSTSAERTVRPRVARGSRRPRVWLASAIIASVAGLLMMLPTFRVQQSVDLSVGYAPAESLSEDAAVRKIARADPAEEDAVNPVLFSTAKAASTRPRPNGVYPTSNLLDPVVGEVVSALEVSDNDVAIVKLRVVDVQEGLHQLEVLLSRNSIQQEAMSGAIERDEADFGDELVAVYVETTSDLLTSVLHEMQEERRFQSLQIEPPELASLDRRQILAEAGSAPYAAAPAGNTASRARGLPRHEQQSIAASAAVAADAPEAANGFAQPTKSAPKGKVTSRRRRMIFSQRDLARYERDTAIRNHDRTPLAKKISVKERARGAIQVLIFVESAAAGPDAKSDDTNGAWLNPVLRRASV